MTQLVPRDEIEGIVGARRDSYFHIARADSATETVYILHPTKCFCKCGDNKCDDLRNCEYSIALDNFGIDTREWRGMEDCPVFVTLFNGRIRPFNRVSV